MSSGSTSSARRPPSRTTRPSGTSSERRARGLFADMRFTMARPEVSCHPETLLPGARTRHLGSALLLRRRRRARGREGRLPRYTWFDAYADLREKLDELGRRLGGTYRVLVDENDHVDREGAARAGVGFYGKNTMLITRRHGSWVVLGTLVTDVEVERSQPLELDCGSCTLCIEACPTGALDEPGVLDSTRCLSYWTQAPRPDPRGVPGSRSAPRSTAATSARTSARGTAASRSAAPGSRCLSTPNRTSRSSNGSSSATASCAQRYDRLYFPRNDPRFLRRNALVALGNTGAREHRRRRRGLRRRRRSSPARARGLGPDHGSTRLPE